jgi:hypothetical protein
MTYIAPSALDTVVDDQDDAQQQEGTERGRSSRKQGGEMISDGKRNA